MTVKLPYLGQMLGLDPLPGRTGSADRQPATGARKDQVAMGKTVVTVTPRRLAHNVGRFRKGQIVLVLNPRIFGSKGENWLEGIAFDTRDAAYAAAKKVHAKVLDPKAA